MGMTLRWKFSSVRRVGSGDEGGRLPQCLVQADWQNGSLTVSLDDDWQVQDVFRIVRGSVNDR